jgi:hypothetical protein
VTLIGPHLYQILHPWHWLTYSQNAAGVQTVIAGLGFAGLIAYTAYTRRMKNLQQDTRRAELFPSLALASYKEEGTTVIVSIRNVGRGAALDVLLWHQMVSDPFVLDEFILKREAPVETLFLGALSEGERQTVEITISTFLRNNYLFVVDCHDVLGGPHQFRVMRHGKASPQRYELQTNMVQSPIFLPWRTRRRLREEEKRRAKVLKDRS